MQITIVITEAVHQRDARVLVKHHDHHVLYDPPQTNNQSRPEVMKVLGRR